MSMKRNYWTLSLLLISMWLPVTASAVPFSKLVVLGDSLSDQGNISLITGGTIPPPEYTDGFTSGRFTNGRNYIDHLVDGLGLSSLPSVLGGSNYAHGGARTDSHILAPIGAKSILEQLATYQADLAGGGADNQALHVVWGGANNVRDIIERSIADLTYDPSVDFSNTLVDMATVINGLALLGAEQFLIPNLPDIGLVPLVTGGGPPVLAASALASLFNTQLANIIDDLEASFMDVEVIRLDTFALSRQFYDNPMQFGFSNVSDACYSEFVASGGTTCAESDAYLSWDGFHPTARAHQKFAAKVFAAIPEPASSILLLTGLLLIAHRRRSAA
jgi:outer membrane lipase/esterase